MKKAKILTIAKQWYYAHIVIPDDSSPDGCAPSMWGSYKGEGEQHIFFCKDCFKYIEVDFPRWDKILSKMRYATEVLENVFKCPSCIKSNFVEVELIE